MEIRNKELEVNLWGFLNYLQKKKWILIIVMVISVLVGAIYTILLVDVTYKASTRMYVLNRSSDAYISSSDYSVSTYMISDYKVLITGENVTEEVIKKLNLSMTSRQLSNMISVSAVDNTRVLQISVVDTDPQRAADIANCVREIASEQIKSIVNVEAVNLVYEAKVPQQKAGPSLVKNAALTAILGAVICIGILVIVYIMDDTIRTEEDVEHYLGLSVLGVVPVSSEINAYVSASGTSKKASKKSRNARK